MTTVSDTMHANAGTTTLTHRWGWLLVLGVVQIIAGSMAIPIVASFAAIAIFGAVLLVTATFQLIHAFKVGAGPRSAWYGLNGVLYAIAGLLVIAFPLGGALTLALLLAILFIADGALRVLFAISVSAAVGSRLARRGRLLQHSCRSLSTDRMAVHRTVGHGSAAGRQPPHYGRDEYRLRLESRHVQSGFGGRGPEKSAAGRERAGEVTAAPEVGRARVLARRCRIALWIDGDPVIDSGDSRRCPGRTLGLLPLEFQAAGGHL